MLLLRVALRCGFPSVRHLLAAHDLTSNELVELAALEMLDPAEGTRLDVHAAQLAAVVANSRMAGKGAKSYQPSDFLIRWGRKPKKASNDEIIELFKGLAG